MNFFRELNAFRDWSMLNGPSTGQVALWYSLMSINNAAGWVEWFTATNQTLQLMTGLSRQGLDKARNQLVQKGLIEYRKGISNQAGKYRMVSFECQKVGTVVDTGVGTQVGTTGAFQESHQERDGRHKGGTLLDIDKDKTKTPVVDDIAREIHRAYEQLFGRPPNHVQLDDLHEFTDKGMEVELVIQAMKTARLNGAGLRYAFSILERQFDSGILTVAQAERDEAERQIVATGGMKREYQIRSGAHGSRGQKTRSITGGKVGRV